MSAINRAIEVLLNEDNNNYVAASILCTSYRMNNSESLIIVSAIADLIKKLKDSDNPKFHGYVVSGNSRIGGKDWYQYYNTYDEAMTRGKELCSDNEHVNIRVSGVLDEAKEKTITIQTFD